MHNRRQSLPAAPNGLSNGAVTSSVPPSTSAAGPPPPATPPSPPVSIWVPIMSTLKKFRLEDRSSCRCIYETNGRTQRRCRCNKEGKRISEVPIRVERVSLPSEKPVFRLIELPDEIVSHRRWTSRAHLVPVLTSILLRIPQAGGGGSSRGPSCSLAETSLFSCDKCRRDSIDFQYDR